MKQFVVFLSGIILSLFTSSCLLQSTVKGNGNVTTEERDLEDFNALNVSRGMNVYVTMGNDYKVVVEADENLHKSIVTELHGEELRIKAIDIIRNATSLKVFVTLPQLEAATSSSGSNVFSENVLNVNDIDLSVSSGANLNFVLNAEEVSAKASSGSNIFLEGKASSINAKASSGSNIKAGDLKAKAAQASVSSGANIWLSTENELQATASSGGNVFYNGNPSETEISKSSGGNVIKN
ncbi:head GIN domain-containing protein [uncultured Draconibacterium sp.]|uniref:head GIN domain-containing protein n=1 Tax=uncultured Draconibacterium sp. TaxID=1573823 RepID=UPI0029C869D6|nr:head GIN domain-containing protein [uncultured Draconibacterium sp.]